MLALKKSSGYTLLEMLVTLAIVAVIAAFAAPSFQNMIITQGIRSTANDLVSTLNFARSEALKRNSTVTVAPAGATWAAGWTTTFVDGGTTVTLQSHAAIDKLAVTGDASIAFLQDGRRSGTNDDITVVAPSGSGSTSKCVRVSATGKVSITGGACS